MTDELEKGLEGSGHGVIEVLSRNLPEGAFVRAASVMAEIHAQHLPIQGHSVTTTAAYLVLSTLGITAHY